VLEGGVLTALEKEGGNVRACGNINRDYIKLSFQCFEICAYNVGEEAVNFKCAYAF
jgi:hypothetical protein